MWHLRVHLVAEGSSDEEQVWHHFRLFVQTAQISIPSILITFFSKSKLERAIVHFFLDDCLDRHTLRVFNWRRLLLLQLLNVLNCLSRSVIARG